MMINKTLAEIPLYPTGGLKGKGPLGLEEGQDAAAVFAQVISSAVGLMTVIAFIWFLFLLITGAIGIMTAGGDKMALENARKRLTTGVTGLIIVITAIFILGFIATLLGIPGILNFGEMIETIAPE